MQRIFSNVEKAGFFLIAFSCAISPILVISSSIISFEYLKAVPIIGSGVIAVILFFIARLKDGEFIFSKDIFILSALSVPLVTVISAFVSNNSSMSLIGYGFEPSSALFISVLFAVMLLVGYFSESKKQSLIIYGAIFLPILILAVFHSLRFIFGVDFLSFGLFNDITSNSVGKWNDLAIIFGLLSVFIVVSIEFLNLRSYVKVISVIVLFLLLVLLTIVNMVMVWYVMGIFALFALVYALSFNVKKINVENGGLGESGIIKRKFPLVTCFVLIVSVVFIISGNKISGIINEKIGANQIDVRPSLGITMDITNSVLKKDPVFGVGPNRFTNEWLLNKSTEMNMSPFWNFEFSYGFGLIPTFFINTGILGIVMWVTFLFLFAWFGWRALMRKTEDEFSKYLIVSSFSGSLFLWIFALVYIPSVTVIMITFVITGVFIGSLFREKIINFSSISLIEKPKLNFVYMLAMIILLIVSITIGYSFACKYVSVIFFQKGIIQANNKETLISAENNFKRAIALSNQDIYYRALSEVYLRDILVLFADKKISKDDAQKKFQSFLSLAEVSASEAVKLDVLNYANWMSLGRVYESVMPIGVEGSYGAAKLAYNEALKRHPTSPVIYTVLAGLEKFEGNKKEARRLVDEALRLKSDYAEALNLKKELDK